MEKYLDTRDTKKTNLCMLHLLFKIFNTLLILNKKNPTTNKIACLEKCYAVWRLRNIVYRLHISLSVTIADTTACMMCKCRSSHSLIISSWLCFPVWLKCLFHNDSLINEGLWSFLYKVSCLKFCYVSELPWSCSVIFAVRMHVLHHQHVQRSHLLAVYGSRW